MASNPSFLCISPAVLLLIIILFFTTSPSNAANTVPIPSPPPSGPIAPESACNATLYPDFCKSLLPHNKSSNVNDYCRFSIRQSMSTARKFMDLVDSYLARRSSTLSATTVRALKDCRLLAELNIDFFSSSMNTLGSTTNTLNHLRTDDLQALLSATVTNQQTCSDGLHATSGIGNGLDTPLSNGNKLYSVSLALFNRGWVPKHKRGRFYVGSRRKLLFSEIIGKHGSLNLRMSNRNHEIFESVSRRKLLQTGPRGVVVRDIVTVNRNGRGNFTTINDAVAAAPNKTVTSDGYFMILVVSGVYQEYVNIPKNKINVMMIGAGINKTIITGNQSVVDGSTTFNSATFIVVGQGFVGINMTIRNTAGPSKGQAVALRNGADLSTFYKCSFEAYQDTLYTHSLRQVYRECDVYGTVDFIFGNAAVVLQNCNIYSRLPGQGQFNTITAQGRTDPGQNTGTSIHNCTIRAAPDLASSNRTVKTYLGRPWKQYSRTVYMQSFIDTLIDPAGWDPWNGDFLSTLYYAEFGNRGPGSNTSRRVNWAGYRPAINSTEASQFTVGNFTSGGDWLPATGVPFKIGLI